MARFCDKCGAELKNENGKFCDKCGAEVKITSNQSNTETTNAGPVTICPQCGQTTPMGLTNCENCGSSLENNTTAVIVGYIVTFLFPLFGLIPGIYLLTRNNGKAKTQGVFIIGIIIIYFISLFIIGIIAYLLMIVLIAIGIVLWYKDYDIFN